MFIRTCVNLCLSAVAVFLLQGLSPVASIRSQGNKVDRNALLSDWIAFVCGFASSDSIGAAPGAAKKMFDALYANIPA